MYFVGDDAEEGAASGASRAARRPKGPGKAKRPPGTPGGMSRMPNTGDGRCNFTY